MTNVTRVLLRIQAGDSLASEELFPMVYQELRELASRRMAHEQPGQTLHATALVHEAYLRLVDTDSPQRWDGRGHFFAAAAEAMRRILVENARRKQRVKHGGQWQRSDADMEQLTAPETADPCLILSVHEAIERLAARSPRKFELVK